MSVCFSVCVHELQKKKRECDDLSESGNHCQALHSLSKQQLLSHSLAFSGPLI